MSDISMNRRGFLSGVMATVAAAALPGHSAAQSRSKPQYLILADSNHNDLNIKQLNNHVFLKNMASAGYKNLFLEIPKDIKPLLSMKKEIAGWYIMKYQKEANVPVDDLMPRMTYIKELVHTLKIIDQKARMTGIRVHFIDPMSTVDILKNLANGGETPAALRKRVSLDPQMASNIKKAGSSGVVVVGLSHADNMKRLLPNAQIEDLKSFGKVMRELSSVGVETKKAALTPG